MEKTVGVKFDDVHSFDRWGLKLCGIEIGFPEAKTVYVDIPGMHGMLDLTEAQHGGVVYGTRKIKFTFDARDCRYRDWPALVSSVAGEIEGREKKIVLDIDPEYYYKGRCHIDTKKTNETKASIVVDCQCKPHKMTLSSSEEPWIWDTFSFEHGVITKPTKDIVIASATTWTDVTVVGMTYNDTVHILTTADCELMYGDDTYDLKQGNNVMYDLTLSEGENTLKFRGSGKVTVVCRGGKL